MLLRFVEQALGFVDLDAAGLFRRLWCVGERTPASKQMVILRRADHMHFMDAAPNLALGYPREGFPSRVRGAIVLEVSGAGSG